MFLKTEIFFTFSKLPYLSINSKCSIYLWIFNDCSLDVSTTISIYLVANLIET